MIDRAVLDDAVARLVERAVVFLPSLLVALGLAVAGWIVARLVASLARRAGRRLGLDGVLDRAGIRERLEEAKLPTSVVDVFAILAFWLVFLLFLALAVQRLGVDLSIVPVDRLFSYLPNVFGALLLLVVGALVAQIAGRATQVASAGLGIDFHRGLGRATKGLLLIFTVVLAIDQLGFDVALLTGTLVNVLTILAAGAVLTFALGGKGVAQNVLSGYYVREHLETGQRIAVDGAEGILEAIGTLNSEIATAKGRVLIPNSKLVETTVRVLDD